MCDPRQNGHSLSAGMYDQSMSRPGVLVCMTRWNDLGAGI